jgi:prepilin peptidase CpaA
MVIVLAASLVAGATDVWRFRVPNLLTLPLLLSGLLYHALDGPEALGQSCLGALLGFAILITFYVLGGMGAGDVKLLMGIGAWLGVSQTLVVFVAGGLVTGIYALVLILLYGSVRETCVQLRIIWYRLAILGRYLGAEDSVELAAKERNRHRLIPFATMVAVGLVGLVACAYLGKRL